MSESNEEFCKRVGAVCEAATEGPWKAFPNPMRDDGLFVSQDKEIKPYPGAWTLDGQPRYPATPKEAWGIGVQIESANAVFIALARTALPDALERLAAAQQHIDMLLGQVEGGLKDQQATAEECDRLRAKVERLETIVTKALGVHHG